MIRWTAILSLFLVFFSVGGRAKTHPLPTPQIETLPSGLTLAWFLRDSLPLVDLALLVQTGSRNDPPGRSGTSQLVSQLLDRGARGQSALEMAKRVEKLGGSRYIQADEDTVTLGVHGLAEDAYALLDYIADLTLAPDFKREEFEREKARMMDRWEHVGDYTHSLASLVFHRIVSAGTPYGRGPILDRAELQKIQHEDVLQYYQSQFQPKKSVLMIVGHVQVEPFKKRIEALFKDWNEKVFPFSKRFDGRRTYSQSNVIISKSEKGVLVDRKDQSQVQIRLGFRGPLLVSPDHYALSVANAVLGETFQSRLNSRIRDQLGITYGIQSQFTHNRDLGVFAIGTSCRNEVVGEMLHEIDQLLIEFHKKGITEDELVSAKDYLLGSFPIRMTTLAAVASRWLSGFVYGLDPNYLNEYESKIRALDLKAVNQAIRKHFGKKLEIVVSGTVSEINKHQKIKKMGTFKQVKAKDLL